jgi:cytochrome c
MRGVYEAWVRLLMASAGIALAASSGVFGQSCASIPPETDFKFEVLASKDVTGNALDIAVSKDLKVYWVERMGAFKAYDPRTKKVTLIREFPVLYVDESGSYQTPVESGLEGLALDGDFEHTRWIYVRYAVPKNKLPAYKQGQLGPVERLSRFTMDAQGLVLDTASEKIILEYQVFAQCCHFGGDLNWSPDGNLWMSTGDNQVPGNTNSDPFKEGAANTDARSTAANANDLRGKVLRIKPIPFPDSQTPSPGVGSTYNIPAGNLRDYYGKQGFWSQAEQEKVRPEIYSMGHRNPYSVAIHPEKFFPAIGEAGGGGGSSEDEINILPSPANCGWPFFLGGNAEYQQGSLPQKVTADAPMNRSRWNTGVEKLPPAFPAAISSNTAAVKQPMACLGVVQGWGRYDSTLDSKVKFPPYLSGKLFFSSYGLVDMMAATVNDKGAVTKVERLFHARSEIQDIHRSTIGPDGALYIAGGQYTFDNTTTSKIVKISYAGPCSNVAISSIAFNRAKGPFAVRALAVRAGGSSLELPVWVRSVEFRDLKGALVWEYRRGNDGVALINVPTSIPSGLLQVRMRGED